MESEAKKCNYYISICIPSYNRPDTLVRLLQSIDYYDENMEIVICEDSSPARKTIRQRVAEFKENANLVINYYENDKNYGYDRNLRECIQKAEGKWIIYMGDDDVFIPGELKKYITFLHDHEDRGYVLRSYNGVHVGGEIERFQYYDTDKFFDKGYNTYVELFRKSVFISGFTFQREYSLDTLTDRFDGSLLYQLYIQAEICLNHPAAYYSTPFVQWIDQEINVPYFGSSDVEKDLYTAGKITVDNSVNFVSKYFVLTE